MSSRGSSAEFQKAVGEAKAWLSDALDLWSEAGVDVAHGGFHDRLTQGGVPEDRPKRCRVQARQIYVFVEAGRLGWPGPWEQIAENGLRFMLDRHRLPNGAFRFQVHQNGSALADVVDNYDQAFALFALAHANTVWPGSGLEDKAVACLSYVSGDRAHPSGGFFESGQRMLPLLANPHMHLLEAAVEWRRGGSVAFENLGAAIVELATTRFVQPGSGALHEFFDGKWRSLADEPGGSIEPGHQFEWAWLLDRWDGSDHHLRTMTRLYEMGRRGVDPLGHVAVAELNEAGAIRDASTRLWPQTERLKAALMMARRNSGPRRQEYEEDALDAWKGLKRFLDVGLRGLWLDRLMPDGSFIQEGAPASSLYHIVGALSELFGYARVDQPLRDRAVHR